MALTGFSLLEKSLLATQQMTKERFYGIASDGRPRRICFGTTHANALRKSGGQHAYIFKVPYSQTIEPLIREQFGLALFMSKFDPAVWRGLNEDEAKALDAWLKDRPEHLYIRDQLDLSAALGMNMDGEHRTELGEIENRAKWFKDEKAIEEISRRLEAFIGIHPPYELADVICPVPPRPGKEFDLPTELAGRLGKRIDRPVLDAWKWANAKPELKKTPVEQKWNVLEAAQLEFDPDALKGKRVLLLDDLYQSGVTMNFVASKLQAAGARRVFGISVVKSMRDTDNAQ